ncbi:MAG TPA: 3-deoxy-8-phosphooctulonate synthase [Candidatus Omnitrophica bacterium]|nr:MAG: 3-deoxy-8-phosphooctulonate synthase [Omnitrophica WOR_2 bacterium GWA2_53_43]HBO96650.1 3-deoxy-8-phosphooctulonate synthase [Candidatus Omnitrophota bacterium]HCI45424.1 3-deoxy-8-phosphooctulonate synthase [Candidatus Omnitrophota bacterium]
MIKKNKTVRVGSVAIGGGRPFVLIAGPCVIESRKMTLRIARALKEITAKVKAPLIFKASYDKANRTSVKSFRGPGWAEGLDILAEVRREFKIPVLSDVHNPQEIEQAAGVLDVLQIPAFLCRQTDLLLEAGKTGKPVNIKKGQFLAPWDMAQVVKKVESTGNRDILLTERGTSFGYNTLVSDFRSLSIMRETGYPVVFDATHSVQQPGGLGTASGGNSEYIPLLARCAVAAGCDAVFMEIHPNPKKALSDGPNMLPLSALEKLLIDLQAIDKIIKRTAKG